MDWKKYAMLIIPAIILTIILIIVLPQSQSAYAGFIPLLFWGFYYAWIFIEKKRKNAR